MPKIKQHQEFRLIVDARHHDPFHYLGLHKQQKKQVFRAFLPFATQVEIQVNGTFTPLNKVFDEGLFELVVEEDTLHSPCLLKISEGNYTYERVDAYSLPNSISSEDLYLFAEGRLKEAYRTLGAQKMILNGVEGTRFAVWAPNAERVSVVGNFNRWDGRVNPMRTHGSSGVWDIFLPGIGEEALYKFEIRNRHTGNILVKADPYAKQFEARPGTACKVTQSEYLWNDEAWITHRKTHDWLRTPFNCYEVHLGSWRRDELGHFLNYRQLADQLIPYLKEMGYTHIELLPITEHPLNESWGYQTTGYFAVTNRFGNPDDFRYFVDQCHQAHIGVILDWVPGHFPKDDWALARYDGTALYEHEDPRLGEHQDWGTYIFNYGRNEVRNFLISNAHYWLNEFHLDGLRVDAVASMLYLDYSRKEGEWLPNKYGGRENLDAIEFLRQLNIMVHEDFPGAFTIAEESTSWPMISRPVYLGGLGFSMKWNMGWMNDTLDYMKNDPIHRRYHHNQLTFGQLYAYSENFVLPFSHDEVVHGKKSLLDKMPGDTWQKFANLRLLFTYQMTNTGRKLNFMGNEFAQGREWNVNASLDWQLLNYDLQSSTWHRGIQQACRDLNYLYKDISALHELDFDFHGFEWIDCQDMDQSIISYIRRAKDGSFVLIALNFTPVVRHQYRIGAPVAGHYEELFNSDSAIYAGSNQGNGGGLRTEPMPWMNQENSMLITLPPLAGIILKLK